MSLAALHPEVMEKIFEKTPETQADGEYIVQLFMDGKWRQVRVNDKIPTQDDRVYYCQSKGRDELWPSLLEKAVAKYYGGYSIIEGGLIHYGLVFFTGGFGEYIYLQVREATDSQLHTRPYPLLPARVCVLMVTQQQ